MKASIRTKLEMLTDRFQEIGALLAEPEIMADQDINVIAVNTRSNPDDQTAQMALTVELFDADHLALTMEKLRQLPNVLTVERSQ